MPVEPTAPHRTRRYSPTRLPPRRFVAVVSTLGGIQLLAMMDGTVAIFALPKIQNELGLSDATRSWVITAYVLTFGGLMLLGGRIGDTIGQQAHLDRRRRAVHHHLGDVRHRLGRGCARCGPAAQGGGRRHRRPDLLWRWWRPHSRRGRQRNAAMAVFGAMASVGSVLGLVAGGALTEVSWRLAFLVNVPIGLLVIYLARTALQETEKERMKLDAGGGVLATLACTAAVFALSTGPEKGWLSAITLGSSLVALAAFVAFALVERTAENPIVPFSLFFDRNRMATFAAMFLTGGVTFTMAVLIALYVQNIMGYGPMRAAIGFIPFAFATAIGAGASSRLVTWFPPRVVVIAGAILLLGAMLYGSTLNRGVPYFPNLVLPIVIAGIGLGMINVPLGLSLIASVDLDRIGPASAIAMMVRSLGGPLVLAVIQAAITSRTLHLGGTHGPVKFMNDAQLHALDHGYTYGCMWLGGVVILIGGAALLIGYTAQQVAHAQEVKKAIDAEEL